MTEIGMALSNPLEGERVEGCVGKPLPGVQARIVRLVHSIMCLSPGPCDQKTTFVWTSLCLGCKPGLSGWIRKIVFFSVFVFRSSRICIGLHAIRSIKEAFPKFVIFPWRWDDQGNSTVLAEGNNSEVNNFNILKTKYFIMSIYK